MAEDIWQNIPYPTKENQYFKEDGQFFQSHGIIKLLMSTLQI